jgi:hypothetical protein
MNTDVSLLWPSVARVPGSHPAAPGAPQNRRRLAEHAAVAAPGYESERVADLMVVLETLLVDLSLTCTAENDSARALAGALTAWRTSRDLAGTQAELASLLGTRSRLPVPPVRPEAGLMAACARHVDDGLPALLSHIGKLAGQFGDDYLEPARLAVTGVVEVAGQTWAEDRTESPEATESALGWLLGPVSAAHACVLMAKDAEEALRDGDRRAATVTRRWAYSRVRTDTIALLSERHVSKTRLLIGGLRV